jgi:transketolase
VTTTNYEGRDCRYGLSQFGWAAMVNDEASEGSLRHFRKAFSVTLEG